MLTEYVPGYPVRLVAATNWTSLSAPGRNSKRGWSVSGSTRSMAYSILLLFVPGSSPSTALMSTMRSPRT